MADERELEHMIIPERRISAQEVDLCHEAALACMAFRKAKQDFADANKAIDRTAPLYARAMRVCPDQTRGEK